ncbi:uncharacterized protein LOC142331698 [Lycorma delicatula]|uniref:uncharacterized protein LOC142331698 n=1 Tax=Lycorma delicatula TaxID=130591 RepID=UPI003F513120
MDELLLSVLFADTVGLASESVAVLQDVFNRWKCALESHGLKISESKTEYMFLPLSDAQASSPDIMINGRVMPKCTSFKYLGPILNQRGGCEKDVNHRITVAWLKWQQISAVLCDKRMPPKLKGRMYTTVVRPALTYGAKCWTRYEQFDRDLTTAEMKMCRMSLGVTKLDRIKNERIRGSLQIKESVAEKISRERNDWFEKIDSQHPASVIKKIMALDIPPVRKRGRPKNSWCRQLEDRRLKHGLTRQEKDDRMNSRMTLRSMRPN